MDTFQKIEADQIVINEELKEIARQNEAPVPDITGKMHVDFVSETVWYEIMETESRTTSWVTLDMPYRNALGERLFGVSSLEEINDI